MNTVFLLMAEYGTADIPLDLVAKKYLGLEAGMARRQAAVQGLPLPCPRAGSQKSPWLIRVTDLAEMLDRQREQAAKDWRAMHAA